jgi:hypothetical protein
MQNAEKQLNDAVHDALEELAGRLGGSSDTGGPVENATQIKGHPELGVLLTDAKDHVLGRVWIEFRGEAKMEKSRPGKSAHAKGAALGEGSVGVHAEVVAEVVDPPIPLEQWVHIRH